MTDTETYTCELCKGTFANGWSEEEAAAEARTKFNVKDTRAEGCSVLCDPCYQKVLRHFGGGPS